LSREPAKISLRDVISAIQGPVRLNKCLVSSTACSRQKWCPIRDRLEHLQLYVEEYLENINFAQICSHTGSVKRKQRT
jgi:DNA-binding IscR family transcriptional regulator